ncbi:MAG: hypothetical protein EHM83_04925 [Burkholderiales bacterium]|nr:MAG: hypothetical protein EHM83_04925 [Burkholderiales bacterium]
MPRSRRDAFDARLSRAARALVHAIPALLALVLALVARHAVVEPADIAHACDPAPWAGWCAGRTLLVYSFATQGIGWLALAAGTLATLLRRRRTAQLALVAGTAGLVLYSFEPSAFGALLGLMVLVRVPPPPASLPGRGQPTQAAT